MLHSNSRLLLPFLRLSRIESENLEMDESDATHQSQTDQDQQNALKYLDFVQAAAIYCAVCFSSLYEYAKENAGPLKPGVQTVEGTVKTVIGPVYEKFHDIPLELLKFVDRKVDESINELDRHVPSLVKQASNQALLAAHKAPEVARAVASEVHRAGVVDTAKNAYVKYEPVAEHYAVSAWRSLNQLPLFPQVAGVVLPTVAYWTEKYNQTVGYTAEKGYPAAAYLPLVPIEKIAKVFENGSENAAAVAQ